MKQFFYRLKLLAWIFLSELDNREIYTAIRYKICLKREDEEVDMLEMGKQVTT